jgi:hypothetical protein
VAPPRAELRVVAQKMDEVLTSPLQLSPVQRTEQLRGAVFSAAKAFFTPDMRRIYARRLWHMADYFEKTGRPEQTQAARAEARRLYHDSSPDPSPFAAFLFEKVLLLTQRAREGAPMPAPGEALAPKPSEASASEKRSPGGLILP